ncbi:DUF1778 domain-containing protein [Clostridiaceae bacterium]|nr:DUF1778 domain-containing protein [Clostridiaceae bacterium]
MPKQTTAQKRAHNAYISKFARVEIRITTEQRDKIQHHAAALGESVNAFITRAIESQMQRDKESAEE